MQSAPSANQYSKVIANSKRVRWDIDNDVIRRRRFDLDKTFLPAGLSPPPPSCNSSGLWRNSLRTSSSGPGPSIRDEAIVWASPCGNRMMSPACR